jgi:hypothetical protein
LDYYSDYYYDYYADYYDYYDYYEDYYGYYYGLYEYGAYSEEKHSCPPEEPDCVPEHDVESECDPSDPECVSECDQSDPSCNNEIECDPDFNPECYGGVFYEYEEYIYYEYEYIYENVDYEVVGDVEEETEVVCDSTDNRS